MPMMNLISTSHLVLILCLLLPMAAWAGVPKPLCLAARALLLVLLCAENHAAVMDWMIGGTVAWLPIRERIQRCRAILFHSIPAGIRDS
jgi:hypothetical protein